MATASNRYRGFISYSQKDAAWARRLHKWLETYQVPRGVNAGLDRARRLGRFFRDDEEMSASSDLAATIRGAIDDSASLIVICSPRSAQSKWVNAEIKHFRGSGRSTQVFAIIIEGEPNSPTPETECLPRALRIVAQADDGDTMPTEPLALDVRKASRARICARLAAGLLDVPFDDLWRRAQRRRRMMLAQMGAAAAVVAGISVFFGHQFLETRKMAALQARSEARRGIVDALGSSNDQLALKSLQELLKGAPDDQESRQFANNVLSWARTPVESAADLPAPSLLIWNGLLQLKAGGGLHAIGMGRPIRRIGLSGNRFIVFYDDRVVSLNSETGQQLDVLDDSDDFKSRDHIWLGAAFEGPDGTGVVAGVHGGISNSQYWHALLAITPAGTLSVLAPRDHPAAKDEWASRYLTRVRISSDCRTIGVMDIQEPAATDPSAATALLRLANGLSFAGVGGTFSGDPVRLLPDASTEESTTFPSYLENDLAPAIGAFGCKPAIFNSMGARDATGLGGPLVQADVGLSPVPFSTWQPAQELADYKWDAGQSVWKSRRKSQEGPGFCDSGCTIVARDGRAETFYGDSAWMMGWVESTAPTTGSFSGPMSAEFTNRPLQTFHEQHNAGIESVWCREIGPSERKCVAKVTGMEFHHDWTDIDLRSASGKYVYYSNGFDPFEVYDVGAMQTATPPNNATVSVPGAAAFSEGPEDRLFVFSGDRLLVYEPDKDGRRYVDVSNSLGWNRQVPGTSSENPLIGMTAYTNDELVIATANGQLMRLNWSTGAVTWSHRIAGVGKITALRRSPDGKLFVVVGTEGLRIGRAEDGLPGSGVVVPPFLFDSRLQASRCRDEYAKAVSYLDALTDVFLRDDGTLIAQCGSTLVSLASGHFEGNAMDRLELLLQSATDAGH